MSICVHERCTYDWMRFTKVLGTIEGIYVPAYAGMYACKGQ